MPQSRIELLEDAIDNLIIDLDIINQIVNGDENTEVQTDSGPVSSLKKAIGDLENTARRLRDEAETFRNEASDIKDETEGLSFNAAVSENNAKDSAYKALNSSNDAEDSYVAAYNSANDAQTSATAASSSAAAAQASLEEFQGIYHGRLSGGATPTDPEIGDMYFNEDKDRMEVYTTAGWKPTASVQLSPEDFYEKVPNVEIKDPSNNRYGIEVKSYGGEYDSGIHIKNRRGVGLSVHNSGTQTRAIFIEKANQGTAIKIANFGGGDAIEIERNYGNIIKSENFTVDQYGAIHQPFLYWGDGSANRVIQGNFSDFFSRSAYVLDVINYPITIIYESKPFYTEAVYIAINNIRKSSNEFFVNLNINDFFEFQTVTGILVDPGDIIIKVLSIN